METIFISTVRADLEHLIHFDFLSDRSEVIQALSEGVDISTRYSDTLGYDMMYVAVPIAEENSTVVGIARVALPLTAINAAIAGIIVGAIAGAVPFRIVLAAHCPGKRGNDEECFMITEQVIKQCV